MVALRALERLDDRVPDSQPSVRAKIREGTVSFYLYGCPVRLYAIHAGSSTAAAVDHRQTDQFGA